MDSAVQTISRGSSESGLNGPPLGRDETAEYNGTQVRLFTLSCEVTWQNSRLCDVRCANYLMMWPTTLCRARSSLWKLIPGWLGSSTDRRLTLSSAYHTQIPDRFSDQNPPILPTICGNRRNLRIVHAEIDPDPALIDSSFAPSRLRVRLFLVSAPLTKTGDCQK